MNRLEYIPSQIKTHKSVYVSLFDRHPAEMGMKIRMYPIDSAVPDACVGGCGTGVAIDPTSDVVLTSARDSDRCHVRTIDQNVPLHTRRVQLFKGWSINAR
ncbi:hypothetical protein WA026_011628 [Henosepilachna vigintioctopunctata]|uniref:Uncharacterized protein n=1 Tax=Henosepilachna vigintioctopunctata TaxID=420089 RepID=A0AAW1TSS1_9CUCU